MNLSAMLAALMGAAWMIEDRYVGMLAAVLGMFGERTGPLEPEAVARALKGVPRGTPLILSGPMVAAAGGGGSKTFQRVGSVGVVDVWGVLAKSGDWADTTYASIRQGVADAAADKDVKTILLRIDSPGGEAIPAETAAAEIFSVARSESGGKPIVALADGMMASAAYYLGSQASAVYATPGAFVGSIGTRMDMWNFSGLLDRMGVKVETIKSTPAKDAGSPFRPMETADRKILQGEVNAFDRQFVAAVMRGRGVDAATVGQWQSIRGLMGQHAVDAGMVDGVVNSAEQLVGMLNASPEKYARAGGGRGGMGQSNGNNQVSAAAADADHAVTAEAGIPAEGNVARLIGIAAMAAGSLAGMYLDPAATIAGGGGGGGGGGGTVATLSVGEKERLTAEAQQAAQKAERSRISGIRAAAIPFAGNEKIVALSNKMIDEGGTVEAFNAEAMKSLAPASIGPGPEAGTTPVSLGAEQSEKLGAALSLGLVQRHMGATVASLRDGAAASAGSVKAAVAADIASHWGFASASDAVKAITAARGEGLASMSLRDVAMRCVAAHARLDLGQAMSRFGDPTDLFRAALATGRGGRILAGAGAVGSSDFPELMRNVANKAMMASFAMKQTIWNKICARGTANDFKTAYMVGISELGKFVQVAEGEPIPETKPVERAETIAVKKFANGFSLTYETMVNDDMGVFLSIPRQLGEMAKYIPDDLLITQLKLNSYLGPTMGVDSTAMFDDTLHHNIPTSAALSYDAVRAARLKGRKQVSRGADAVELDIDLSVLLVPTALSQTAEDLNSQDYVPGTAGQQNQRNTLRGQLELAWSNKLGTDVKWWMFTAPGPNSAFEVRFLFGQETPTVAISNQSDLTAQRYDAMVPGVGVAARSWEGAIANAGV
jgi:capsid assembly protease